MKNYVIVLVFIILVSLLVPVIIWINNYYISIYTSIDSTVLSELGGFLTFIISFWGLVLNLILVGLAYKAFKNFDVKKQFHNKQLEIVSELTTSISSLELSNMFFRISKDPNGVDHQIATGFTFSFFEIALGFDYSKFELMCVKGNNLENTFPFLKYRNHPLLPKSISIQLKKLYKPLQYSFAANEEDLKSKNYVLIYVDRKPIKDDYPSQWMYVYYKNPSNFSEDVASIKKSITDWYYEYGADNLNV